MVDRDVFILGAGFSKAINPAMPTMENLTNAVRSKFETSNASDNTLPFPPPPLVNRDSSGRELDNNIELWMTYLSQSQPWLSETYNQTNKALATLIRRYIREIIEQRISKSMARSENILTGPTTSKPEWLDALVELWSTRQASVITLNYDTLVERAATTQCTLINDGNGIATSQMYPPYLANIRSRGASLVSSGSIDTLTYFKLHGSVNWFYSGRDSFYGETIFYADVKRWGKPDNFDMESKLQSQDKEALIIPPVAEKTTYFNNETIRRLWYEASDALLNASRVFAIGYSLPLSDLGMRFFIKRSLPEAGTPWYIVNTSPAAFSDYTRLLGEDQDVRDEFVLEEDPVPRFVAKYPDLPRGYEASE